MIIHKLTLQEWLLEQDYISYDQYVILIQMNDDELSSVLNEAWEDKLECVFEKYLSYVRM